MSSGAWLWRESAPNVGRKTEGERAVPRLSTVRRSMTLHAVVLGTLITFVDGSDPTPSSIGAASPAVTRKGCAILRRTGP